MTKPIFNENDFDKSNAIKQIGNSIYRIRKRKVFKDITEWYINETYNDNTIWVCEDAYHNQNLDVVLDAFNMLDKEKQIIGLRRYSRRLETYDAPMAKEDAYKYYIDCYESGIYTLNKLKRKFRKGELARKSWEEYAELHSAGARDYASFDNMQRGLRAAIKDIWQESFHFKPVPQNVDELDFSMEEKKIQILNRICLQASRTHRSDAFYHNLRVFLVGRIEQSSDYKLVVDYDPMNENTTVEIRDRKEYLKEKYGTCKSSMCVDCKERGECKDAIRL